MTKKKTKIPPYNKGASNRNASMPQINSFLDVMVDGREFESIAQLQSVNVNLTTEIKRSIGEISSVRGRPVICYLANVIRQGLHHSVSLDNSDDAPFLEMLRNVQNCENGLDIILVTPGGSAETVSHLVRQIRSKFDNVTFILPYMAMSAGTIFCMSGNDIIMDEAAFIGPIDPQVPGKGGMWLPAQSVETLLNDIRERTERRLSAGKEPDLIDTIIVHSLDPKEIGAAANASRLSINLVSSFLSSYKFNDWTVHSDGMQVTYKEKQEKALEIANILCDHSRWLSHASRINREMATSECGLKIIHSENIPGLDRAIKRFWALIRLSFEQLPIIKVYASNDYFLLRREKQ